VAQTLDAALQLIHTLILAFLTSFTLFDPTIEFKCSIQKVNKSASARRLHRRLSRMVGSVRNPRVLHFIPSLIAPMNLRFRIGV
jgi:hypothetical protein